MLMTTLVSEAQNYRGFLYILTCIFKHSEMKNDFFLLHVCFSKVEKVEILPTCSVETMLQNPYMTLER